MSFGVDWTCCKCGWGNLDARARCRNCGEPKPTEEAKAAQDEGKISPWLPERDLIRLAVLGKLAEECNELAGRAARCIIQGLDEKDPDSGLTNRSELAKEIADVIACTEVAIESLALTVSDQRSMEKMRGYYRWHSMIPAVRP